jgi:threonine/homoserine/homoserine lactone efflux protein
MMDAVFLFLLGYVVGLSGAIIPGPLLVYTISKSLKDGPLTGFYVIIGHGIVEAALILLLFLGAVPFLTNQAFYLAFSLVGGSFMLYSGWVLLKKDNSIQKGGKALGTAVSGGILFTALNPSFPIWWLTVGARLLLEGYQKMGYFGGFLVFAGHYMADMSYYIIVSYLVYTGRRSAVDSYLPKIKKILSASLFLIGLYFLYLGFAAV